MKNKPLKIVAISDTHGQHRSLKLPNGDVIIHAGDVSRSGRPEQIQDFLDWFADLKFTMQKVKLNNKTLIFNTLSKQKMCIR